MIADTLITKYSRRRWVEYLALGAFYAMSVFDALGSWLVKKSVKITEIRK